MRLREFFPIVEDFKDGNDLHSELDVVCDMAEQGDPGYERMLIRLLQSAKQMRAMGDVNVWDDDWYKSHAKSYSSPRGYTPFDFEPDGRYIGPLDPVAAYRAEAHSVLAVMIDVSKQPGAAADTDAKSTDRGSVPRSADNVAKAVDNIYNTVIGKL